MEIGRNDFNSIFMKMQCTDRASRAYAILKYIDLLTLTLILLQGTILIDHLTSTNTNYDSRLIKIECS